jgi:hypothetical protein
MSLSDLQSWLIDEGLRSDLDQLTRRMVISELDNLVPSPEDTQATPFDWPRLLLAGSILAKSAQRAHQEAALRIATAATEELLHQPKIRYLSRCLDASFTSAWPERTTTSSFGGVPRWFGVRSLFGVSRPFCDRDAIKRSRQLWRMLGRHREPLRRCCAGLTRGLLWAASHFKRAHIAVALDGPVEELVLVHDHAGGR